MTSAFEIGDKVRFNSHCATEYIQNKTAVVTNVGRARLTVMFDEPIGRFIRVENGITKSVEVDVPPSIIDHVI